MAGCTQKKLVEKKFFSILQEEFATHFISGVYRFMGCVAACNLCELKPRGVGCFVRGVMNSTLCSAVES